jgi:radical SAM superfamily enzyme YgiQ (UPF0313 family)
MGRPRDTQKRLNAAILKDEKPFVPPRGKQGGVSFALAYPNVYGVGMSSLGFLTAFRLLREMPDVRVERFFLPQPARRWGGRTGSRLLSLETSSPVADFDILAFSVSFEEDYVGAVRMLEMAGLPPLAAQRTSGHPLVLFGGVAPTINPEPVALFVDAVAMGDAEVLLAPFIRLYREVPREPFLRALAEQDGFYVPSLQWRVAPDEGGKEKDRDAPAVRPVYVENMESHPRYSPVVTPRAEFKNMFLVEIATGCRWGCRFCWLGSRRGAARYLPAATVRQILQDHLPLSSHAGFIAADPPEHPEWPAIVRGAEDLGVRFSIASVRIDAIDRGFADHLRSARQRTLSVAPETGSDRLRRVVHKRFTNREILERVALLAGTGVRTVKLYFLVGLPGEEEQDVAAIPALVAAVQSRLKEAGGREDSPIRTSVSVNCFIPKPGTPFQWAPLARPGVVRRKIGTLRKAFWSLGIGSASFMSPHQAEKQALFSLGDRGVAGVILRMARGENYVRARKVLPETFVEEVLYREKAKDARLPWDFIRAAVSKEFLYRQYVAALGSKVEQPAPEDTSPR